MRDRLNPETAKIKTAWFSLIGVIPVLIIIAILVLFLVDHVTAQARDNLQFRSEAYLPLAISTLGTYPGPGEREPNDTPGQANGALFSGVIYYGNFSTEQDVSDFFFFYVNEKRDVTVKLSQIPNGERVSEIMCKSKIKLT